MNEYVIRASLRKETISISHSELSARLTPAVSPESMEAVKAKCEVFDASNPVYVATRVKISVSEDGLVHFPTFSVKSSGLSRFLFGCDECYVFVATLGGAVDRLIMKRKALSVYSGFITDAVASALIEGVCDAAVREILGRDAKRFSPGYSDLPLSVQREVFAMLNPERHIGVALLDTLLMSPMKSVSAFLRVERTENT